MLTGERKEGTFVEHLEDLRWAIIRSLTSVVVMFPVAYYLSDSLIEWLVAGFCPAGMKLRYFSPIEPLLVQLKMALYLSLFSCVPYILRQFWGFVAPGLYEREKKSAGWLLLSSWLLAMLGCTFAVIVIFPLVMQFSMGFQTAYLEAAIGIGHFVGLFGMLLLGFAVMFQFPAGVFMMVKTGMVSLERIKSLRAIIFVVILIVSAILTPPDVISQLMMGIPTYLLFELGLLAASFGAAKSSPAGEQLDESQDEPTDHKE
ncbi:MAG: Twin-arginine translocation protein TatC [Candidatus Rifleibacterium amylolyticum]|nr:MAG: Twin-arginine translocation protein TatC [Candidatus Rifleibacterium amylolyticum]